MQVLSVAVSTSNSHVARVLPPPKLHVVSTFVGRSSFLPTVVVDVVVVATVATVVPRSLPGQKKRENKSPERHRHGIINIIIKIILSERKSYDDGRGTQNLFRHETRRTRRGKFVNNISKKKKTIEIFLFSENSFYRFYF